MGLSWVSHEHHSHLTSIVVTGSSNRLPYMRIHIRIGNNYSIVAWYTVRFKKNPRIPNHPNLTCLRRNKRKTQNNIPQSFCFKSTLFKCRIARCVDPHQLQHVLLPKPVAHKSCSWSIPLCGKGSSAEQLAASSIWLKLETPIRTVKTSFFIRTNLIAA
jgi:hypothetical protein